MVYTQGKHSDFPLPGKLPTPRVLQRTAQKRWKNLLKHVYVGLAIA
jgi:hypothetical protein